MRSRLEAGYAAWLDQRRWDWVYEPKAFASEAGQYLPDFRIEHVHDVLRQREAPAYVEVKPTLVGLDVDGLFRRMEIIWETEPDSWLLLQAPAHDRDALLLSLVQSRTADGRIEYRNPVIGVWLAHIGSPRGPEIGYPIAGRMGPWHGEYWNMGESA